MNFGFTFLQRVVVLVAIGSVGFGVEVLAQESSLTLTKKWEKLVSKNVGFLAISPTAEEIFILDNTVAEATVFELDSDSIKFTFPSKNCVACYSSDGSKICVVEFADSSESVAKLIDAKSGETIASINGRFKGLLRYDSAKGFFYIRIAGGRIARLNFAQSKLEIVFDPNASVVGRVSEATLRDFDINNSDLYGLWEDTVCCINLVDKKKSWSQAAGKKLTLYLNSIGDICTDSLFSKDPYSIYHSESGVKREIKIPMATWMLRNRESNNLVLIHDVNNVPMANSWSRLEVRNTEGERIGGTNFSKYRCMRLSDIVKRDEDSTLVFASAGINGKVQVWSIVDAE